jgi:dihydrodipicolinate synthase/N-acetylneuraminate lyase
MKGVHAAIVTHFDAELNVDYGAVAAEVTRLIGAGIHGIVPNGSVGEGGTLTREERRALIELCVGAAEQAPVCAGVSAPTAEQASVYARDARSAGAESVMVLPPLLYQADRRELVEFFGTVARAADLPLLVYNNPQGSGSDLQPELLAELVHEVPSIAAIKETSGDARRIAHLLSVCPDADILVGGDDWALEGFCAGAAGWVSGVADILPAECVRLWELCQTGDLAAARSLYTDLLPLCRLDMTPKLVQYFKAALDEMGVGGGPCRPPRLALNEEELLTLREAVARASQAQLSSS